MSLTHNTLTNKKNERKNCRRIGKFCNYKSSSGITININASVKLIKYCVWKKILLQILNMCLGDWKTLKNYACMKVLVDDSVITCDEIIDTLDKSVSQFYY